MSGIYRRRRTPVHLVGWRTLSDGGDNGRRNKVAGLVVVEFST